MNKDIQDDHLLASIIEFRESSPNENIALVTAELSLKIKAKNHNIETIDLPDNYMIPIEIDAKEAHIKELEQELKKYKNKIPVLKLCFNNQLDYKTYKLQKPIEWSSEEIQRRLDEIKQRYPMIIKQECPTKENVQENKPFDLADFVGMKNTGPSILEISSYNERLEYFYETYRTYLEKYLINANMQRKTIVLDILLINEGIEPANDIDIFLYFPDGFSLFNEKIISDNLKPPDPPDPPVSRDKSQIFSQIIKNMLPPKLTIPSIPSFNIPNISISNVSSPTIRKNNSYDVDIHVKRLKHKMSVAFDSFYVNFDSFDKANSFGIDYKLNAANMPNEVDNRLNIIIERE